MAKKKRGLDRINESESKEVSKRAVEKATKKTTSKPERPSTKNTGATPTNKITDKGRIRRNTMMRNDIYKDLRNIAFEDGKRFPDLLEEILKDWLQQNHNRTYD